MSVPVYIFVIAFLAPSVVARCVQFYRKDYTYHEEFDAFYKIHLDLKGNDWSNAFMTCQDEGAKMFYPKVAGDWSVAKDLMESTNYTTIYALVGMSGVYGLNDFVSNDGSPTQIQMNLTSDIPEDAKQCVLMNMDTQEYIIEPCSKSGGRLLAFICKKVVPNVTCPTVDQEYKYNESAGMCYKVNNNARSWAEAWRTCIMEGGSLAVVKNGAQATALKDLIRDEANYFVGFSKLKDFYYSVKGNLIDNEYKLPWYGPEEAGCGTLYISVQNIPRNQNNRMNNNENRYDMYGNIINTEVSDPVSGNTILRTLNKHSDHCGSKNPFICEMELK